MIGWSDLIVKAKVIIDDARWDKELAENPARFFRAKSDYVSMALPLLNRPPNLLTWAKDGMKAPKYDSAEWISTQASTQAPAVVSTGLLNYELCSVCLRSDEGRVETPYTDFTYDPATGTVTFGLQSAEGLDYVIDFYSDGEFRDFDETILRLFALAIAVVWDERFDNDWLNIQMKIHDSSFSTANEGNYAEKISQRRERNRAAFTEELKQYEQNAAYSRIPQSRLFPVAKW